MPYPSLYQINTRVWLRDLAGTLGRPATLADIPDAFLDDATSLGFDYLWFLGLWQTGAAGRQVVLDHPEWQQEFKAALSDFSQDDLVSSPFAVTAYALHPDFGGAADLVALRERLHARGLQLVADFIPNHTALDHPWVEAHPEFYVQGSEADLQREPGNYQRVETKGGSRIFAHGRDPYFPGWLDLLQLNYRHAGLREAMMQELLRVADVADGVRCDMAMLILPEVFRRTWGDHSLPADGTPPVDEPFWPEAIRRVRARQPHFLFMAEVYWDLERELMSEGFDYCYDKRLYDQLRSRDVAAVRGHLGSDPAYQDKLVRFLENHDELRAASAFPVAVHQAAAILAYLIPGLRFFHEGQLEGRTFKVPMSLGRRPAETVDLVLQQFYRELLACLRRPEVRQGRWQLLEAGPAREGNPARNPFLAFAWEGAAGERLLAAVNFGPAAGQARVPLPFSDVREVKIIFQDQASVVGPQPEGVNVQDRSLLLDLPAWGFKVMAG